MIILYIAISVVVSVIAFLVWASASVGSGIYVNAFCREKTAEKRVYLTFDDGPDPAMTLRILDILKDRNAKAAFFLIGDKVRENEEIVKAIISRGHKIGIHSNCHRWFFPFFGKRRMTGDLSSCKSLLDTFADNPVKLFRPPFGVTTPNMSYAVKYLGLNVVGWDIRTFDTVVKGNAKEKSEAVLARISKRLRPGSVILLHDRLPDSCVILQSVLDYLDSEGYKYDKCLPVR